MVGDLVMDRFRVLERIGSGGMGTVYRAFDERLQRQVAVKEIRGADAGRVLREAQAAARLNHPGVVTLYELSAEPDRTLLVSELVDGPTLAELAAAGELSDRDVAELGIDVCDALAHAHERGVVHRDVKPQNVIVRADDAVGRRAKLADFGIAAIAGAPTLTAAGEVVGTLAYMAPEQAEGLPAGPQADTYGLALTLYECWAGTNPVAGETPAATARAIGQPMAPLWSYRPDLPRDLASLVDACLDPDPEARPGLAELRRGLERSVPSLAAAAPPRRRSARPARRAGSPLAAAGAVAALGATAAAGYLAGPGGHGEVAGALALAAGLAASLLGAAGRTAFPAAACAVAALVAWGPGSGVAAAALPLAALTFTPVLRAGHVAVALLLALLWAAGLDGLLRGLAGGGVAGPPQVVAAMAVLAVIVEFRGRQAPAIAPPAPRPRAGPPRPAL